MQRRVGALLLLAGLACCAPAGAAEEAPLFPYQQTVLDNGLRVISVEDFSAPLINVQLWYHVGSKDEQPERQGFAHMFEHMMFRGTDRLGPTDHFDLVRRTGGTCNAYTSFDQTVYHETLPSNQLSLALWLEAERMAFLKIDQGFFDTERKVVEEERRMGLNRPFGSVYEQVLAAVFTQHPYRWSPIGQIPHLRSAAVPELRAFWNRYYVPNNATLVVAGAVPHAEVQEMARRYFGWIPRGQEPPRVEVVEPPVAQGRELEILENNAPAPLVGLVLRVPPLSHPDAIPIELLTSILIGDNSSRLYRELVAEKKLAVDTMSVSATLEQDGLAVLGAVLAPLGGQAPPVFEVLERQLHAVIESGVTEAELTKARNQALKQTVLDALTVEGKARTLGSAAVLEGDVDRANRRLAQIRAASSDDLRRVAANYFDPAHAFKMRVKAQPGGVGMDRADAPVTAQPETAPPPPGRPGTSRPGGYTAAPPLAPLLDVPGPPAHEVRRLDNGLKLIVVTNRELPLVSFQLGLLCGAWSEAKPGTASLALGMLTKGTAAHSEAALAEELGQTAISLDGSASLDGAAVGGSCLSEQLPRAIELLAEVLLTPTFPADEFAKHKLQVLTGLQLQAGQPQYVAQRAWRREVFGQHPYARSAAGEVQDVKPLEVADVTQWWKLAARPDRAVLILAGDVTADQAQELAQKHLAAWHADGAPPEPMLPAPPQARPTRIVLVDRPNATQGQIMAGSLGPGNLDPRYFTSRVVSGYFGGAFNARLNETIRVKRGLTYGARGGFSAQRFGGQFSVSTFSRNETIPDTVKAIFEELDRLAAEPPSTKELEDTKTYLVGSYAMNRETPQQVADELWSIELEGLPDDFFLQELRAVAGTTAEDCTHLVAEAVHPQQLVVVVVGPAKDLREPLEKIAPVEVVED